MSAEVSFTKRAAAELSRCFNGLTVSRSSSAKKTNNSGGGGGGGSGSGGGNPSSSSPAGSSSSSASSSASSNIGSNGSKEKESGRKTLIGGPEETTLLLSEIHGKGQKVSTIVADLQSNGTHCKLGAKQPGIPVKVETIINKTNSTTIAPLISGQAIAQARGNLKSIKGPSTPSKKVPPRAPPKTSKARRKNYLLGLQAPKTVKELWADVKFLNKFFYYFTSTERCVLSQVCSQWRDILYSDSSFWKGLIPVIYCTELRRYTEDSLYSSGTGGNGSATADTRSTSSSGPSGGPEPSSSSSTLNSVRQGLYSSIEKRGFDSICLFGATDADVIDFASKISPGVMRRCFFGSLRCSSVSDKGLEIFLATLNQSIKKLELSGCNEITDSGLWTSLVPRLESLVICDCINIADETIAAVTQMLPSLKELTLQAYHVTDVSMTYFGPTAARENLKSLCLQHCWELSNQGILNIAHGLPNLTTLSLSGCSKITDDAIEVIAEQLRGLKKLDLSWCSRISDAALEYIACDLSDVLLELILDRSPHITDIGLGYIATMSQLTTLTLRWCPQIRDFGLQTICSMKSLKVLSIAGCPQLSVNSLSCLVQMQQLVELELTNCPGVTKELLKYLREHLPSSCTIIV